jgi:glutamate transport system substrate-binding protein
MGRRTAGIALIGVFALAGAACSSQLPPSPGPTAPTFSSGTTMARLHAAQKIIIGTRIDQPLFGQIGSDGKPSGFDVEIGKLIANALGIPANKIEFVEVKPADREQDIQDGTADIIVGYPITETRKLRVDFAGPYFSAGQDLLVRRDDSSINGPDSFRDGVKKVCAVTGTTEAKDIGEYVKSRTSQLVLYPGYQQCVSALKANQVDAVTTDNITLLGFVSQDPTKLKILARPFSLEPHGVGLKKGDNKFRSFINDVLDKIYEDGRYARAWQDAVGGIAPLAPGPAINRYA